MRTQSEVAAMLELNRRGWSIKRITAEFGINRNTVRRYVRVGGWTSYKRPRRSSEVLAPGQATDSKINWPLGVTEGTASNHTKRDRSGAVDDQDPRERRTANRRSSWLWMHELVQGLVSIDIVSREIKETEDLGSLLRRIREGRLAERNKALAVIASRQGIPLRAICGFLGIDRKTARKYVRAFDEGGTSVLFSRQVQSPRKADDVATKQAVFALLHEPPANYGINRTTWKMADLVRVLRSQGCSVCPQVVREITKAAGYRWRKARTVLTSKDPDYARKLEQVQLILAGLSHDEAFFSIDEFGPFAVKVTGGRSLMPPSEQRIVPQWQRSKGSLTLTAALEL